MSVTNRETPARRPWKLAALWLAFLGPFFFASYGFANWLTGQRAHVDAVVFDWETRIPFLPWTIVPYWTIDAFYGVSLFLCVTAQQVHTHARRLLAAQLVCIACFLLFPLRFSFDKPDTHGFFGWLFDTLAGFDKPFNQAPSLHIVLLVILWVLYTRHLPRAWHWLLHAWFALIGVSVLTTYQHHFIDVPTGLWAGCFCVWLLADEPAAWRLTEDRTRRRIASGYALGALLFAALALSAGARWPVALWLWWPAFALTLVAVIYLFLGASGFRKGANGRYAWTTHVLFAPYFIGARINSRWWTRQQAAYNEIVPGLLLGRMPARSDVQRDAIAAVVDLTAELGFNASAVRHYRNEALLDLAPISSAQLARLANAIEEALAHGRTLVCCALGYSRSALAVAAWLLASGRARGADEAIAQVRKARPIVVLNAAHQQALQEFARGLVSRGR